MQWSTACPDWEQRIVARESLVPFAPLFPDEAEAALEVFKSLRMVGVPRSDGKAGWATFGEACEPFVFDFVAAIFGAYDKASGERLISEFMLLISKKNGKSTIAAGIMLTALIRNWRAEAGLSILAPTQRVAGNSFKPAAAMVRADPKLSEILKVVDHQRTIRHLVTKAELKVLAADTNTVGGSQDGFVLVDELWLFGKKANAGDMLEEATGGLASRPEGFVVYLTTHSNEPPAGVFKDKLEYFRDVRDGVIEDPQSFGMLYEWPEAMLEASDYLKPELFYVTNPNIGRSVSVDFIKRKVRKASDGEDEVDEEDGEAETLQVVLAKYLNVEIGLKLRRDRWRAANSWEAAGDSSLRPLSAFLARCEVAVVGLDVGEADDLFGFAICGREKVTKRWLYWTRAFARRSVLKLRKEIAPRLLDFERDGDLVLCEHGEEILRGVVSLVLQVKASGLLPEDGGINTDPAMAGLITDALVDAGFSVGDGATGKGDIFAVHQSVFNLTSAIKSMEWKLRDGAAAHAATALMAWCVGNAKAILKGNGVSITKADAGKSKIDPLIACIVATKRMEMNPEAAGLSAYSGGRGLLTA